METNQLNPNFTFDVNSGFIYQAKEPFVVNDTVYIAIDNAIYASNGVDAPTLQTLTGFNGTNFVSVDQSFFTYNNEVYSSIYDPNINSGYSTIWKTNGTTKEILSPIVRSGGNQSNGMMYDNKLFFKAGNSDDPNNSYTIFKSEGTTATTQPLFSGPNLVLLTSLFPYQNQMFFYGETSNENVNDRGLYKTTITPLNTNEFAAENGVVLYPNPAQGHVQFISDIQPQAIRLYTLTGQLLYDYTDWSSGRLALPSQKGLYLLQLTFDDNVVSRKVLVE